MTTHSGKKNILIICPSPKGTNPGQRLKYEQYLSAFEEAGYVITISSFQSKRFWKIIYKEGYILEKIFWTFIGYCKRTYDLMRLPFYDGVYIFMAITPIGPPIFERLAHFLNKRIIFDIEDMAFISASSEANRWIEKLKGKKKYYYLVKNAQHVITSSPGLSKTINHLNANNTPITATFDTDRFVPATNYSNDAVLTIGWTGSHSTIQYLHLLDNVFIALAKQRKFKLIVISNSQYECDGLDIEIENIQWTEKNEVTDLQRIDIGVYPVPIEPWVLGKSGCKTITYMSMGIPSVSTAYGNAAETVVDDEENGFLVLNEIDWVERLKDLIDSQELRKQIATNARMKAVNCFSVEANKKIYLKIFEEVFNSN